MADPISITGLVLAVISVIQGGRKLFSRLWNHLKVAFGGLHSQSALMTINQYQLQRQLTALMEQNASLRNEAARRYLAPPTPWNPFGWSDDD